MSVCLRGTLFHNFSTRVIMNDSELDFVDLCSKLLKRVRKKPAETKQTLRAEQQASSQTGDGDKRRRNPKKHGASGSKCTSAASGDQPVCTGTDRAAVSGGAGREAGNAGSSVCAAAETTAEGGLRAKDKVLSRMRQFKRESPQKMVHKDKSQATGWNVSREPSAQLGGGQGTTVCVLEASRFIISPHRNVTYLCLRSPSQLTPPPAARGQ